MVHHDSSSMYVAQELDRGLMKLTFLQFEIEIVLLQLLEDLRNIETMVSRE